MHVSEGLGFSSLVLVVVCLVFPVIAHVIRPKWRRSVARTDEIKRLLVLAAEEAARAEMEATVGYSSVVSVTRSSYQCAVCYSPTTTRCARCKAVRYCSGKCQIIHWRQGHKEECRPPSTIYHPNDDGRSFVDIAKGKGKGKGQHDTTDESYEKESIGTSCIEHVMATPGHVLRVPTAKDDNIVIACIADSTEEFSASESASDTFSGFSASPSAGELSSDGFASESIISSEEPDAQISYDIGVGILDHAFDKIDGTNSLSPKSASLVDSASDFNKSSKVNQSKQCSHAGESRGVSTKSPDHISEISVVKPGKVSSGFWGRTLECATCRSDALDDSPLSNSIAAGNINCSDDVSFQQPKRTGNNVTSSHAQDPELKGSIDDSHSGALKTNKPIGGALAENTHASVQKSRNSLSSGTSNQADNYSTAKSNVTKSSEPKSSVSSTSVAYPSSEAGRGAVSTDLNVSSSQSSHSGWSNLVNSSVSTSHIRHSSLAADASCQRHPLSSDASGLSVPSLKTEKVTNAESTSVTSTQMASHSAANSISGLKSSVRKVVEHFKGPKKYCDKGLFPYDLFVRLYTSNKVAMQPCGLINCGNSCYANVVLQCLAFTPPLAAYFFQGLHSKACVNKEWCLNCEFEGLILKANEGKSSLSPIGIISQLQNIGRLLGRGREEDAHEFLRYAIDTMQSAFLKEAEVKAGSVEEETTLIGLTFGGYLRSKIKCTKCHYKSERRERMMDLTVEIEGDIEKLEDALRRFTSTEILDGDNKYLCSRCKSYEKAKKKLTILEAPNVLTITLKRFQSGKFGKLNKSIQFQEILDLAPYMSGTSDKSPIYRLYGVVVHLDIMNAAFSGHYVCYVKNVQNKWFKVDDSLVMPVEHDKVLSRGAYMLLYARCVPRDPKLIRNHIIFPDPKNNGCPTVLKSSILNSRRLTCSSVVQLQPNPISPNNTSNVESFYLRFHRLQRVFEEDSSSDTYSFTSSNSDEGSCSTDSSRESTSTEDFSDYIFGAWNSPWRNTSEADASSFSPSYVRHSSSNFQTNYVDSTMEDDDTWDRPRDQFFHTDANKHYGKAVNSSCRKSDKENILRDGLILAEVKQLH